MKKREANAGEKVVGIFEDGHLITGTWYKSDGNKEGNHSVMRNPFTQIVYIVLLLFPLSVWGQQTGEWKWENYARRLLAISSDVPFATAAYDFTERYLTQLQKMSVAERKSQMERDNVWITQGSMDLLNLINEQTSMNFSEKENRYIVSLINESFLLIELSFPASCQLLTGRI